MAINRHRIHLGWKLGSSSIVPRAAASKALQMKAAGGGAGTRRWAPSAGPAPGAPAERAAGCERVGAPLAPEAAPSSRRAFPPPPGFSEGRRAAPSRGRPAGGGRERCRGWQQQAARSGGGRRPCPAHAARSSRRPLASESLAAQPPPRDLRSAPGAGNFAALPRTRPATPLPAPRARRGPHLPGAARRGRERGSLRRHGEAPL